MDKFVLDIMDTVQSIVVDMRLVLTHYILPHFAKAGMSFYTNIH